MSNSDDSYIGILLEQIRDQNKAVLEAVGDMRAELKRVPKREEFDELKQDVKVIKAAVTDLSRQVNDHERRRSTHQTAYRPTGYSLSIMPTTRAGLHLANGWSCPARGR